MLLCLLLAKPGLAAYCCAKNKSIKPRQRSGATIRFLCQAFFLAKESGEGRDTAFPSPQTPLPQEPSRDCCGSLGSSIKLLRLRSRGECLWHSFRSLAAYCSSSAHPRNICCVGFARMVLLAKFIRMRTARSAATASHPCVERPTEGIKKKNPADVTPLGFCQASFQKRRSSRDSGAARQFAFFAKLSFSRKKNPSETSSTGVLQSFFSKAFFALHYGQSRALLALLAQSHT